MFIYSAMSFEELASPLSHNKVFLLVEITDPFKADRIDLLHLIMEGLNLDVSSYEAIEKSLERGYLVAETAISDQSRELALSIVEFFRRTNVKELVQVYLFINEQLIEHSRNCFPSMHDLSPGCPLPAID